MKKSNPLILLVDDDPNDLLLVQAAFKAAGIMSRVQPVVGGAEAIAYMMGEGKYADRERFEYPTFVITDLKMPDIDGFAVLEHLKKNPEWAIIPTVVLSGSQDTDDIRKAYLLGASSYHVKPGGQNELRALVKTLHDYWMLCEVPQVDQTGRQLETTGDRKLGERYSTRPRPDQHR